MDKYDGFKFIHFRHGYVAPTKGPDGKDTVTSFYYPNGGATIAYRLDKQGLLIIGASRCSPRDNFNRKVGRAVAHGRALTFPTGAQIELGPEDTSGWTPKLVEDMFRQALCLQESNGVLVDPVIFEEFADDLANGLDDLFTDPDLLESVNAS